MIYSPISHSVLKHKIVTFFLKNAMLTSKLVSNVIIALIKLLITFFLALFDRSIKRKKQDLASWNCQFA